MPPDNSHNDPENISKRLQERLDQLRQKSEEKSSLNEKRHALARQYSKGLRLIIDLVAPILVGTLLGRQLDLWLDTAPFLLIILFLLGTACSFYITIKSATRR